MNETKTSNNSTTTLQTSKGFWKGIGKFFKLKIHGDELMSKSTEQWMFASRIAIILMAISESFSWGYFGGQFGSKEYWYLTAGFMGVAVFLIIWLIDSTFMTLDRYKRYYHARTFLTDKEAADESKDAFKGFWNQHDTKIGILTRVFIIGVSMYFTAGYLTDLFFHSDIKFAIEKYTEKAISEGRSDILTKYDTKDSVINAQITDLNKKVATEVAGKGESGRYGLGDAAKTLQEQITEQKQLRQQNQQEKLSEVAKFDTAVARSDFEMLGKTWGVDVPENSSEVKSAVKEPILKSSEGKRAERAIQGFLAFIFLSLMLFKIFEPRSVRIYFSDALQQHYKTYKAGGFDSLINNPEERFKNGKTPMQPFRFEEFMLTTYHDHIHNNQIDEERFKVEQTLVQIQDRINQIEEEKDELYSKIKNELDALNNQVKELDKSIDDIHRETSSVQELTEKMKLENKDIEEEIQSLEDMIKRHPDGGHGRRITEIEKLQTSKAKNREQLSKNNTKLIELKNNTQRLTSEKSGVVAKIEILEEPIKKLEERIAEWKKQRFDLIEERLKRDVDKVRNSE